MSLKEYFKQLPEEKAKLSKEEKVELNNKDLVVKHNALINATSDYTYCKNELRIICKLISDINNTYEKDFQKKVIRITDLDFSEAENFTNNYTYLVDLCRALQRKTFCMNGSYYSWFTKLTPVSGVGIVEYEFHNDLKPFLLDLKTNFTKYHLTNILKLRSSYSIQIFELLMQYKTIKQRKMTLEELRKVLNIPNSYSNKDIRRMLEGVQKDLQKNTSITFDFTFEKLGKQFNSITFNISKNTTNSNIEDNY